MSGTGKVDILTRVEGHGFVELVRDGERVVDARFHLHESPRLFEALLLGKRFDEVAEIACRICSICSTVHKVAALQAVERALEVRISRQTRLLRELAVEGGQIESHALHIFCLALPDYLGVGGFPDLAKVAPQEMQLGLNIKALGNLIQETVGGRAIHPFNLLIGGLGKVPGEEKLRLVLDQLAEIREEAATVIQFVSSLRETLPPLPAPECCAVSGGTALFGDVLTTSSGEVVPADAVAGWLNEQNETHSHAKVSRFDGDGIFMAGPLSRLKLSMPPEYADKLSGATVSASLLARAIELNQALERAMEIISTLLTGGIQKEALRTVTPKAGEATALIEAPRGTLLHSYRFDSHGICESANIITPTAINQAVMEQSLRQLVSAMEGADHQQVRTACERLIRCFDPCISCAVH